MTQVAPFLKPPKDSAAAPERDALNVVRLPLAGFLRRLGAFLMDAIMLYAVARSAAAVAGDAFLRLGHFQDAFGVVAAGLYFALGNGPVGKGRTIGKALVGIRTTTKDGAVPSFARALARTAVLFPGFVVAGVLYPIAASQDPMSRTSIFLNFVPLVVLFATFVACVFSIVFNPFRQGLHDFAAGTVVRPANAPNLSFAEICEMVGGNWTRLLRQAQVTGWATFVLVCGAIATLLAKGAGDLPESVRSKERIEREILAEAGLTGQADFFGPNIAKTAREITEADILDLYDPASTKELKLNLVLGSMRPWIDGPDLEEKFKALANAYQRRVVGEIPADVLFRPGPDGKAATNLRARPLRLGVAASSYVRLAFVTVRDIRVREIEFTLPPLEDRPAPTEEATPPAETPAEATTQEIPTTE